MSRASAGWPPSGGVTSRESLQEESAPTFGQRLADEPRPGRPGPAGHCRLDGPFAGGLELSVAECLAVPDASGGQSRTADSSVAGSPRPVTVDRPGGHVGVVARVACEQPGGGGDVHGRDGGGVDDRVPVPLGQLEQILGASAVPVQRLGTWPAMAAQPPREGRDVIATADARRPRWRVPRKRVPPRTRSRMSGLSCRAGFDRDDTFRQELTSVPAGLPAISAQCITGPAERW